MKILESHIKYDGDYFQIRSKLVSSKRDSKEVKLAKSYRKQKSNDLEMSSENESNVRVEQSELSNDLLNYTKWWNKKLSTISGKIFIFSGILMTILSLLILPIAIIKSVHIICML